MLKRIEGSAVPPRGDLIAQAYVIVREMNRPGPEVHRFGFCNEAGEFALKVELHGQAQATAFADAIRAAGYRLIDPPRAGYDCFFEPLR